ncbi:MAG: DUF1839 family protein [Candidatus Nanopelagicales bacterium]
MSQALSLLPIDVDTYRRHRLHDQDRDWTETNCYIDLWIEVLAALGLDPHPAGACALSAGFIGDQWTFVKFMPEDLRDLYGVDVAEMNLWKPVLTHVIDQLEFGRLLTVEVDSFHLPDTAGVSYQIAHAKTTVVPNLVDVTAQRMDYFHNADYYTLSGDDFDGIFNLVDPDPRVLVPYVELVDLSRLEVKPDLVDIAVALAKHHVALAPADNPILALAARVTSDLPTIAAGGLESFHLYAFGMLRQCGVTAELAADFCAWLVTHGATGATTLTEAAASFREVSQGMKALQLRLARAARGRSVDVAASTDTIAESWEGAMNLMRQWHAE